MILINFVMPWAITINADLTDEGWSEDIRVTYDNSLSTMPKIALYNNNVHVVWEDDRNGKREIYYKHSTDNGTNWGPTIKLNGNYGDLHSDPSVAVNGNNIHVVWETFQNTNWVIYYKRSFDNGNSWQPEIEISDDDIDSNRPKIAIDMNNLCVIWGDKKDGNEVNEVYFTKSNDNGDNWSSSRRLSANDGYDSVPNDIVVNNDKIYVVWEDYNDANLREIYFKNSNDFGNNWEPEKRLSKMDDIDSMRASIGVCNNDIHVVWTNKLDLIYEIGYTRSSDNGINWVNCYNLSEEDGVGSANSHIVVNNENIYVIWDGGDAGFAEIYYKTSQDNGDNWNSEIMISDNDDKISGRPRMANWQDFIYVVWQDNRDGNFEIYFKRKGNTPPKLTLDLVEPSYGTILTNFNFSVTYSDIENDSPLFIYVNINGINYSMNETDKNDLIFSDGKKYYYSTTLSKSESHTYCFYTSDGQYDIKTEIFYGPLVDEGTPAYIEIQPSYKAITTDDYVKFSAKIFDANDTLLNYLPMWHTTGGGIIDQTGNFTATTPGNWTIFANLSEISGKAIVNITLGKLIEIEIFPSSSEITTDDYIQFNAIGYDSDENIIDIKPTWEVTGGGEIDQTGNFSATTPGFWLVFANDSGISKNTSIEIKLGELNYLEISPSSPNISTDDYVQFSAIGYDSDNNLIDITPKWEVTGGGVIDETGNFTATKPGVWIVFANISDISINTTIEITIGKLNTIEISPSSPTSIIGDYIQFHAKGFDADGNLLNVTFSWEAKGGGDIDQTGNFTALVVGNWTIIVTRNEISTSSNITINPRIPKENDKEDRKNKKADYIAYIFGGIIIVIIAIILFYLFILKPDKIKLFNIKEKKKGKKNRHKKSRKKNKLS